MEFIIEPIANFIGIIFTWIVGVFQNEGFSLIILSIFINLLLLPLYMFAERIENDEKAIQLKMKPKLDEFKKVYKGYELHLYTKNVYRINDYHPFYALRGLVSLIIQIPFFMGAYQYLSSYPGFIDVSFLIIKDLSATDALVNIGSITINILPLVMTLINLWSGVIYARNGETSEKVTIVVIALFFLIILYNSPSALLIYWTFNNVFSLVKNMISVNFQNKDERMVV